MIIKGRGGKNTLVGRDISDTINGFGGADVIYGFQGNGVSYPINTPPTPFVNGGGNSDHDVINGGNGNDTIHAGGGNDIINAGNGNDSVNAGNGNDLVHAGNGNDFVDAGEGNDTVDGGNGHDILAGDLFNNGVLFDVTQPINGKGATTKGVELTARTAFTMLPGWLGGFGIDTNYTRMKYKYAAGTALVNALDGTELPYPGLSRNSYNVALCYDRNEYNARIAYTYRDRFFTGAFPCCAIARIAVGAV